MPLTDAEKEKYTAQLVAIVNRHPDTGRAICRSKLDPNHRS